MAHRLYRREPIKQGTWYYSVACKGCGQAIYALDDPRRGAGALPFLGAVELSIACLRCSHDDVYSIADVKSVQSTEDMIGGRPARTAVSPSSRKPLWKAHPKAKVTLGVGYIEDRPGAAAIVARVITSWADIEVECARLLAELMGTNVPAAAAVFGSLRSSRAQSDALSAAAVVVLNERDFELFSAHMARRASLEKERNDLAHGCFGVSAAVPDHVIWVDQTDYLLFSAKSPPTLDEATQFNKKLFVYELGTLERIAQEIAEFYEQLGAFRGYLTARRDGTQGVVFRAQRYPQLCSQPHIRQALDRLRTAKK